MSEIKHVVPANHSISNNKNGKYLLSNFGNFFVMSFFYINENEKNSTQ